MAVAVLAAAAVGMKMGVGVASAAPPRTSGSNGIAAADRGGGRREPLAIRPAARGGVPLVSGRQAASPPSSQGPPLDLTCNSGVRVRREYGSLTPAERDAYTAALVRLRSVGAPPGFGREESEAATGAAVAADAPPWDAFEAFVGMHAAWAGDAHGSPQFLPWHRLLLLGLENALRRLDPSVTLPYWDWSMDAADPAVAPVWAPSMLGGTTTAGGCIVDGPFRGWSVTNNGSHCVSRGFISGRPGDLGGLFRTKRAMQALATNASLSFDVFARGLETAHGDPHVAIGHPRIQGNMYRLERAAADPAFWAHHTYIDAPRGRPSRVWGVDVAATGDAGRAHLGPT
ncbi:hypothetical protein MMPV_004720 [Pyropia vietnamensis]